jgi:hypothetical protein
VKNSGESSQYNAANRYNFPYTTLKAAINHYTTQKLANKPFFQLQLNFYQKLLPKSTRRDKKSKPNDSIFVGPSLVLATLNEPENYTELCFICDASSKNSKAPFLWKRCQFNDIGKSCPNICCGECGPRYLSEKSSQVTQKSKSLTFLKDNIGRYNDLYYIF